jgi:glyoxylase-like metal-dependent hydrolase (beta-lactamase superfamily II)
VSGRWIEVARGVYARRYAELDLTVGLVVGDGACLVVDTRGDAAQGAELAAAVREVTAAPWRIVLTHAHFDHAFGTIAFTAGHAPGATRGALAEDSGAVLLGRAGAGPAAQGPEVEVWAHRGCARELEYGADGQRAQWVAHYEPTDPATARALAATPVVAPNRLMDERAVLDIGGREVVLLHPGRGHTGHDMVVHVPDAGIVFAGDLVEHGAPPDFGDSHPLDWPSALDTVLDLGPTVIVPGHGDPVDRHFVRAQRADLAAVAALCRRAAAGHHVDLAASPYPPQTTRAALARVAVDNP